MTQERAQWIAGLPKAPEAPEAPRKLDDCLCPAWTAPDGRPVLHAHLEA